MDIQLRKALSVGASLVLGASPSFAAPTIQTQATLYGNISGNTLTPTIRGGSFGIASVRRPSGIDYGHYCILPTSSSLKTALEWDVAHNTGYVNVQLTQTSIKWPVLGMVITQVTGANVTKSVGCNSDEIAVSVMEHTGCAEPTGLTDPSLASCTYGWQNEDSDFTVMYW